MCFFFFERVLRKRDFLNKWERVSCVWLFLIYKFNYTIKEEIEIELKTLVVLS